MFRKKANNKSIEQLENDYWNTPAAFPSGLVEKVFLLRKKKISELDSDDIRVLISQNIGLKYLVPEAIGKLEKNLFEEALYYPGDLLLTLLGINDDYWQQNIIQRESFAALIKKSKTDIEKGFEDNDIRQEANKLLNKFLLSSNN